MTTETPNDQTATAEDAERPIVERLVMPCDLPCPKCGSADIYRRFKAKGQKVDNEEYDRCSNRYASGRCHHWTAYRDHIDHKCRCCGHRWQTFPLPKKKRSAA